LRFACLPTPVTLDGFDVDAAASIDRRLTDEPGTCHYLESATNILLIGPPSTAQVLDAAAAAKPLAAAFQAGSVGVVGGLDDVHRTRLVGDGRRAAK
jgi:IstB-like ATP binding protein